MKINKMLKTKYELVIDFGSFFISTMTGSNIIRVVSVSGFLNMFRRKSWNARYIIDFDQRRQRDENTVNTQYPSNFNGLLIPQHNIQLNTKIINVLWSWLDKIITIYYMNCRNEQNGEILRPIWASAVIKAVYF